MSDKPARKLTWQSWLLGLSLLINFGLLGGYVYHRYIMLPPPERWQGAQKNLHLSEAQRTELMELQRDLRKQAAKNMAVMREHHDEFVELLRQDQIDLGALEMHLRATTEPQVGMQRDVILRMLKFRDHLTADQKKIFNEKMERPGFLLRLAGFPGPMWRSHHCRRDDRPHAHHHSERHPQTPE